MSYTTTAVTPIGDWEWYFNYRTECWDKVAKAADGSYVAYQYNKTTKKWDDVKTLEYGFEIKGVPFADRNNLSFWEKKFAYWYSPRIERELDTKNGEGYIIKTDYTFESPDKEPDNSRLGQVWKFDNGEWQQVDVTGSGKIDPTKETYIIIHGLNNSYNEKWIHDMASVLIRNKANAQILCIDWGDESKHATNHGDIFAAAIDDSAARASIMLSQLIGVYNDMYSVGNIFSGTKVNLGGFETNIKLIGHSFGAHQSAYFAKYVSGIIPVIYGLDSAEETSQANPIILGPDSAPTVFFYKSSDTWGGGDTWMSDGGSLGEEFLPKNKGYRGDFNFYLTSCDNQITILKGLTAGQGVITESVRQDPLEEMAHGYAYQYFCTSAQMGITGLDFDKTVLADIAEVGVKWHGVVHGPTSNLECVTIGYDYNKEGSNVIGWNYFDYNDAIKKLLEDEGVAGKYWNVMGKAYMLSTGKSIQADLPQEIFAQRYITAYDIENLSIAGSAVEEEITTRADKNKYSASKTKSIEVDEGTEFTVSFDVHNLADNLSFSSPEVLEAQEEQKSVNQIWISKSETFDASNALKLHESDLFSVGATKSKQIFESVEITAENLAKLLTPDELKQYQAKGTVELYLHVRTGVNRDNGTDFIDGELTSGDNQISQKITVNNDGIKYAFVIDTTGSMENEISAVRNALANIINSLSVEEEGKKKVPQMMLITFKDYVRQELVTDDLSEMLSAVSRLEATEGGDWEEWSNHAVNHAVNRLARGGSIFMATDAPSHKGINVTEMLRKAAERSISISCLATVDSYGYADYGLDSLGTGGDALRRSSSVHAIGSISEEEESLESEENADDVVENAVVLSFGEAVTGTVNYADDRYDWYAVDFLSEYTYSLCLNAPVDAAVLTLYSSDGEEVLRVVSSGERFTVCPDTSGRYYLRVRAQDFSEVAYTLDVEQIAKPSIVGTTLESFSILSTETGGIYLPLARPYDSTDYEKYEAAAYNLLNSMTAPAVISVGPDDAPLASTLSLVVSGSKTNWRNGLTTVSFSTDDIKVNSVEVVSATRLIVNVTIEETCSLGGYDISVLSGSETAKGKNVLSVIEASGYPQILSVSLTSSVCGSEFTAMIYGSGTNWDETTSLYLGSDVIVTSYEVIDATTIRAIGKIDEDAELGFRSVSITTGEDSLGLYQAYFVSAKGSVNPEILMVTPNTIKAGETTTLVLTGRNVDFTRSKVMVDFGTGVTVKSIEVVDSLTLKVTVASDAGVEVGFRDVKVMVDDLSAILLNGIDITVANDALTQAIDLAFASDNRAYRVDSLGASDTVDYFRITPEESRAYRVGVESSELLQQVVLSVGTKSEDGSFAVVRSIVVDSGAVVEEISGLALAAGKDYYIAVQTNGVGEDAMQTPYTLRIDPCGNMLVTDDNTAATANKLSWGESSEPANRSWVGYGDAEDYYLFKLDGKSDVRLSVSELTSAARVTIHKENAAGGLTQVSTHSVRSGGIDHTMSLTSGTYFVEIASYDNGAGRYNTTYALELEKEKEESPGNKEFAVANG